MLTHSYVFIHTLLHFPFPSSLLSSTLLPFLLLTFLFPYTIHSFHHYFLSSLLPSFPFLLPPFFLHHLQEGMRQNKLSIPPHLTTIDIVRTVQPLFDRSVTVARPSLNWSISVVGLVQTQYAPPHKYRVTVCRCSGVAYTRYCSFGTHIL